MTYREFKEFAVIFVGFVFIYSSSILFISSLNDAKIEREVFIEDNTFYEQEITILDKYQVATGGSYAQVYYFIETDIGTFSIDAYTFPKMIIGNSYTVDYIRHDGLRGRSLQRESTIIRLYVLQQGQ
jgi:hypothetical protein